MTVQTEDRIVAVALLPNYLEKSQLEEIADTVNQGYKTLTTLGIGFGIPLATKEPVDLPLDVQLELGKKISRLLGDYYEIGDKHTLEFVSGDRIIEIEVHLRKVNN